jgi:hypothetical protein
MSDTETVRVSFNQKDALLIASGALSKTAGTAYTSALDLGDIGERGVRRFPFELLISCASVPSSELPATAGNTFSLQFADTLTFDGYVETYGGADANWKQSGNSGESGAFEKRFRPATDQALRYVRVKCVTAGTGTIAQTGTFELAIVS